MLGVPKATLSYEDSLEGLPGPRKAVLLMLVAYYHENLKIKIGKRDGHLGQSPGKSREAASCPLALESYTVLHRPAMMCDNV